MVFIVKISSILLFCFYHFELKIKENTWIQITSVFCESASWCRGVLSIPLFSIFIPHNWRRAIFVTKYLTDKLSSPFPTFLWRRETLQKIFGKQTFPVTFQASWSLCFKMRASNKFPCLIEYSIKYKVWNRVSFWCEVNLLFHISQKNKNCCGNLYFWNNFLFDFLIWKNTRKVFLQWTIP